MKPMSALARKRARIQGLTYLLGGLVVMAFMALYLAPRAQAERALLRSKRGGNVPSEPVLAAAPPEGTPSAPAAATEPSVVATEPEPTAAAATEPVPTTPAEPEPTAAAEPEPTAAAEPAAAAAEPAAVAAEPAPEASKQPPEDTLPPLPKPMAITRFSTASAELGAGQREQVARAARAMQQDPTLHVTIRGHADQRGTEDRNEPLSEQRAQAVASALRAQGIDAARLEVLGAGSHQPLDPGSSLPAHARNRRVDLVFHRKETP